MRLSGALAFSLGLALVAAYAVYAALRWPPKAALFPLTMGVPLVALALAQALIELREPPAAAAEPAPEGRRILAVFAWMAGFIAFVLLAGFPIAVPVFVFLYLATDSRERWFVAAAGAALAWGFFHVVFERLLHFPFDSGLIRTWFQ